jgi:hypothetical protein|tara:strand:- start:1036 stop:1266 length:231 start_codon:yes stop_codon:yes gene_type:complete
MIETSKKWIAEAIECSVLLIALGIVLQVLFGMQVEFFDHITQNIMNLLNQLGDNGLVGLIALGVILWLFRNAGIKA